MARQKTANAPRADVPLRIEELTAVGRFASRLAGEARQPLSVLRTAAFFLNQQLGDDVGERARYHLTLLLRAVQDLDGMVSNVAALANVDFPARETADVQAIVDAAVGRVHVRPGIVIETALAPEATIFCDAAQIRLALTNVIENSVQAMPAEGRIRVECRHEGRETHIAVIDDGPGMPEEVKARVFEPGFSTAGHRVGIGLTAAQRLVGAAGGTVEVESAPGAGTTVTFRSPRHEGLRGRERRS